MKRLLFAVAIASVLFGSSLAAAPKSRVQASVILNDPTAVNSASAKSTWAPSLGDNVSFTSTFPDTLSPDGVYIQVLCYQNGSIVYTANGYYNQTWHLGGSSSPWLQHGGDAHCRADLYYWGRNMNIMASTEFDALG